jgi:excinuclease ABC subunit A
MRATDHDTSRFVRVRGAREHNLKDVDVDIPRDALVVFSGVSGSGKSSLAFGTLYAEAQRRYFESVSPYARRLIDQVGVPDVDSIEGLPPRSRCSSSAARRARARRSAA